MRTGPALTTLLCALALVRVSHAEERKERDADGPHTLFVEATTGVGTPVGFLGSELVVVPLRALAIHGGVGLGSQGVQVSAGARVRYFVREVGLGLGASWSSGRFAAVPPSDPPLPNLGLKHPLTYYWEHAQFLNIDASAERRVGRIAARIYLGIGYVINGRDALELNGPCYPRTESCSKGIARVVPYLGFSVAFGIL
jgi:hypothetical protein